MSGTIHLFENVQTGAPVLNGVAGSLVGLLDACLVNGFNTHNVGSIVVASAIATVTVSAGHGKRIGDVVLIAGASPAGLNGKKRVLSATTTTYTFTATGIGDQAATGTIVEKTAAVGWGKPFAGSNIGAYRGAEATSTQLYLRVDDTDARSARAVGYESMTDIDTGVAPFPTEAQFSGGLYWHKSDVSDSGPRDWLLLADDDRFVLFPRHDSLAGAGHTALMFGDIITDKAGDGFHCTITGIEESTTTSANVLNAHAGVMHSKVSGNGCYLARDVAQLSKSAPWYPSHHAPHASIIPALSSGSDDWDLKYPSQVDGGLVFTPVMVVETNAGDPVLRGSIPGFYWSVQQQPANDGDRLSGAPGLAGRELMVIDTGRASSAIIEGRIIADLTGPWD